MDLRICCNASGKLVTVVTFTFIKKDNTKRHKWKEYPLSLWKNCRSLRDIALKLKKAKQLPTKTGDYKGPFLIAINEYIFGVHRKRILLQWENQKWN